MSGGPPTESPSATPGQTFAPPGAPSLPNTDGGDGGDFRRDAAATPGLANARAGAPAYRTEQQRARSVYRRANPWYRRLARGVIGLAFLTVGAAALYFGARELQDYLNRDRLPAAGVDIPAYRTTEFLVTSGGPSPILDGTLAIDVTSRAFTFTSRPGAGPQVTLVSSDGQRVLVEENGAWRDAAPTDATAGEVLRVIPFLVGVDTADDVLINRMRNGYVELDEQETEGIGDNSRERYDITIDVGGYNAAQPLQWQSFQQEVVPGIGTTGTTQLTFWLDNNGMLVRLVHPSTSWSWERLSYSENALELPPAALAVAG